MTRSTIAPHLARARTRALRPTTKSVEPDGSVRGTWPAGAAQQRAPIFAAYRRGRGRAWLLALVAGLFSAACVPDGDGPQGPNSQLPSGAGFAGPSGLLPDGGIAVGPATCEGALVS